MTTVYRAIIWLWQVGNVRLRDKLSIEAKQINKNDEKKVSDQNNKINKYKN